MQHNLRDPNRDRTHGRVYRVTYEGRPLNKPVKVAGERVTTLLALLKEPEGRLRYRAKIELTARPAAEVLPALGKWLAVLDTKDPRFEHHRLEGLWLHQHFNQVNQPLLDAVLTSREPMARAAAVRVLCYQRDRVSGALDMLKRLAADEHPRVRLEAVRAASFFTVPEAVEVAVIAGTHPTDEYIEFVRNETLKTLDRYWKKALADNRDIHFTTDAGQTYLLRHISSEQLLKRDRTRAVCVEMLARPGLLDDQRREAVRTLAKLENKPELTVVIEAIRSLDAAPGKVDTSVVFDLVRQLTSRGPAELAGARGELEKLATTARQDVLRQIGFVSLLGIDQSSDKAWRLATQSTGALTDFVNAMPLVADASLRASLYEKIEPLLAGLPGALADAKRPPSPLGRFVRIELPRAGTLTLAEVEVTSGGKNVARTGRASQKNTASGGDAARAIDGNTSGEYGADGQTHTEENTKNPWWEVDLGAELPIESITIYNRTDGYLGRRLDGFTLKVLAADRSEVFKRERIEAPRTHTAIEIGQPDPAAVVRASAMLALTYARGQEGKTFAALAPFVSDPANRTAAIRALKRINKAEWPKDLAAELLSTVTAYVSSLPPTERTAPEVLDALEFADSLASLLPADAAKKARAQLSELGVRVVRVGTIFERMSYDKDVIAVRAGKPVEFLFENSDLMPHNFVIARPGSLETIGLEAERTAQEPSAAARHFVPVSKDILLSSTLLQPRASEKLSFTAPTEPGVYPYVCTYPGHWRRMYGALYVVDDLDAYLENPESYLAAHPLEIKDPLLADRRPRTEWKYDDLAAAVGDLHDGRSFGNGKQLFQVANCVACHKLDGQGNTFGPELSKLDAKMKALDILKELIEPSARINEKYQPYTFELDSGKVITGLVLEETPARIRVIENPLAKAEATELVPSEIVQRQKSATSIMPKGLLDKLSREEILDLIAYVASRGNAQDAVFQGSHDHAGHH